MLLYEKIFQIETKPLSWYIKNIQWERFLHFEKSDKSEKFDILSSHLSQFTTILTTKGW